MAERYEGKVVVVTGAAAGIGKATALRFAAEGALVVLNDRSGDDLEKAGVDLAAVGRAPLLVPGDVTDHDLIERLVRTAVEHGGRLDVMHNNAGGTLAMPTHTVPEHKYRRAIALNLDAVFFGCQAALRVMVDQRSGVILNTASVMGVAGEAGVSPYGAAKAGVINLTRCIAVEYAALGIRANAIVPGAIDTEGNRRALAAAPAGTKEKLERQLPMRRMGLAEEVANVAAFLCSDEASYVTGAVIAVDGGQSAKLASPDPLAP